MSNNVLKWPIQESGLSVFILHQLAFKNFHEATGANSGRSTSPTVTDIMSVTHMSGSYHKSCALCIFNVIYLGPMDLIGPNSKYSISIHGLLPKIISQWILQYPAHLEKLKSNRHLMSCDQVLSLFSDPVIGQELLLVGDSIFTEGDKAFLHNPGVIVMRLLL